MPSTTRSSRYVSLKLDERRNLHVAWPAPGRPEVDQDHLSFERRELHVHAVRVFQRELQRSIPTYGERAGGRLGRTPVRGRRRSVRVGRRSRKHQQQRECYDDRSHANPGTGPGTQAPFAIVGRGGVRGRHLSRREIVGRGRRIHHVNYLSGGAPRTWRTQNRTIAASSRRLSAPTRDLPALFREVIGTSFAARALYALPGTDGEPPFCRGQSVGSKMADTAEDRHCTS